MITVTSKIAVVPIVYNISNLIAKQVECIRKFSKEAVDIIVIDNSNNPKVIEDLEYYCTQAGVQREKIFASDTNGSESNTFACNMAYQLLKNKYDFLLFMDHDMFPIREFSIPGILEGRIMAGLEQPKSKSYFSQCCVMWDNKTIDKKLIDFSYSHELGLDTGGELWRVIDRYTRDGCVFFNEKYYQNPYFKKGFYNFYSTINDDMFMHFINASEWNPVSGQEERINSLLTILEERISNG